MPTTRPRDVVRPRRLGPPTPWLGPDLYNLPLTRGGFPSERRLQPTQAASRSTRSQSWLEQLEENTQSAAFNLDYKTVPMDACDHTSKSMLLFGMMSFFERISLSTFKIYDEQLARLAISTKGSAAASPEAT